MAGIIGGGGSVVAGSVNSGGTSSIGVMGQDIVADVSSPSAGGHHSTNSLNHQLPPSSQQYHQQQQQQNSGPTRPFFDDISPRNITSIVDETAVLKCRVKNKGDRTVRIQ